ncbi:hypothetical protein Afil01_54170 [Actinorhabdospora filicis]|uniref:PKD domain-containing protein n=1 Tax=Actinorhabdospora filicis TaxID=1785913 RepID=A0A9W6SRG2_9ACTN|nr:S8 family serine peptidase [Actinorhabdospora filicis]GLZ80610.1 hypothetical protein Afil01_54170 [Actinorhabdospora filicis]
MNLRRSFLALAVGTAAALSALALAAPAQAEGTILDTGGETVPGRYIVALNDSLTGSISSARDGLIAEYGGTLGITYSSVLHGYSVGMDATAARRLAADPAVKYVTPVHIGHLLDTQQNPPSWGLDRIDQQDLPLSSSYTYANAGEGVTAYLVDTGVKMSHADFEGRVTAGYDFVDNDADPQDGHGHGTHTAGTVLGKTYGVAKKAKGVALRVLNNSGSGTSEQTLGAFDWVVKNKKLPAVLNFSVGFAGGDTAVDDAARKVTEAGVVFGAAAGNDNKDACTSTPGRVSQLITVGATTKTDSRALPNDWNGVNGSNYGTCLDIFAPGTGIVSAYTSSTSTSMNGTSMATPHVVGAAALYLSANPSATPSQVRDALVNNAVAKVTNLGSGSPNKLLYVGFIGGGTPPTDDFSIALDPSSASVAPGQSASTTVKTTLTTGAAQTIRLTASGLPQGAQASFDPASVSTGGSSALSITTTTGTPAGTYTVTVTGDGDKADHTASFSLTVTGSGGNTPPTASFTAQCFAGVGVCFFNGTGSSDADGRVVSYSWAFGDGTTGTGAQPTHWYNAHGTFRVTLTVTDDKGATGTVTKTVTA